MCWCRSVHILSASSLEGSVLSIPPSPPLACALAEKQYLKKLMNYIIAYEDGICSCTHTWNILMLHSFFNPSVLVHQYNPHLIKPHTNNSLRSYSSFSETFATSSFAFTGVRLLFTGYKCSSRCLHRNICCHDVITFPSSVIARMLSTLCLSLSYSSPCWLSCPLPVDLLYVHMFL